MPQYRVAILSLVLIAGVPFGGAAENRPWTVKAIAAGPYRSVALTADGSVWEWGAWVRSSAPVRAKELTGVTAVDNVFALRSDGSVWRWAPNSAPAEIDGLTGIAAIASGTNGQNLALKNDGTVWRWGWSGAWPPLDKPIQVSGLSSVRSIAVSNYDGHCLALKEDGTVWSWDVTASWSAPKQVNGLAAITGLATSRGRGIAVKAGGTVWEWRLAPSDPQWYYPETPVQVSGLLGVASVACSDAHCLALTPEGAVWAWGENSFGQLGNGRSGESSAPVQVAGLDGAVAIAAGSYHSLALKSDGTVWAWGKNVFGELGDGVVTFQAAPVHVPAMSGVVSVAAGGAHSLARKSDGTLWAWGDNGCRQLGDVASLVRSEPEEVPGLTGVIGVSTRATGSLAVQSDGTVWLMGDCGRPFLPPNMDGSPRKPAAERVSDLDGVAAAATWTQGLLVALKTDGTVWQKSWENPAAPVGGLSGVKALAAGAGGILPPSRDEFGELMFGELFDNHLALTTGGHVWQWGAPAETPLLVSGLPEIIAIAAGLCGLDSIALVGGLCNGRVVNSIALDARGTVWTWLFDTAVQNLAIVDGLSGVVAISAGAGNYLAVRRDGTVWAWGGNNETNSNRPAPVQVAGLSGIVDVSAGLFHSLALAGDGTIWAWGSDQYGQLGIGRNLSRSTPVQVIPPE